MSGPEKLTSESTGSRTIACAKCGEESPHRANVCHACGAHLHVVCHHCGHRNERSKPRCSECGHSLHRTLFRRASRGLLGKRGKVTWLQIVLLLLAILAGIGLIYFFANYRAPEPESRYAPILPTQFARHA